MTLRDIINRTQKLAIDNSPAILTAIGVTGSLTTAYLTGKASFKAAEVLAEAESNPAEPSLPLDNKEKAKRIWKLYIPAALTATITCTSIVCATRIGTRRAAAMAAAFSISEKAFDEYKDKVVEQIGKNKEQKVRDDIAQDRVTQNSVGSQQVIVTGGGNVLCYDMYTGRYFESDMETLKKAQNDTNYEILSQGYASLSDFYNRIGLSSTKTSDDVGWDTDRQLELTFSTTMSDDDRPCIAVDFHQAPVPNYFRVH